jgi:hypothetical protein
MWMHFVDKVELYQGNKINVIVFGFQLTEVTEQ